MGASTVTGLEFSRDPLTKAREYCADDPRIDLTRGSPMSTGLIGERYDIALARDVLRDYSPSDIHLYLEEI